MSPLLNVIVALGGASFAWRAYSALYERQRSKSHALDPVAGTWWRILSMAVAAGLFSFVLGVGGAAVRGPRWVATSPLVLFSAAPGGAGVGGGGLLCPRPPLGV